MSKTTFERSSSNASKPTNAASDSNSPGWTEAEMQEQVSLGQAVDDYVKKLNDEDRQKEQSVSGAPTTPDSNETT